MKVKTSKGFTLAELLIVMAIMVVLAAIAIPTFGKQLETARESADVEAMRAALTDAFTSAYVDYANDLAWTHDDVGSNASESKPHTGVYTRLVKLTQTTAGFAYVTPKFVVGDHAEVPLTTGINDAIKNEAGWDVSFTFDGGGTGSESAITLTSVTMAAHTSG